MFVSVCIGICMYICVYVYILCCDIHYTEQTICSISSNIFIYLTISNYLSM